MVDSLSKSGQAILELFNLQDKDVDKINLSSNNDGTLICDVELVVVKPPCPICNLERINVKETIVKEINHAVITNRKCILRYHAHRFRCMACGRTFMESNPFVFKSQKISALTVQNILTDLKIPSETFSNVANRYSLSATSVASIFDQHVVMERSKLPRYLCIDEAYAFHSSDSKYVCMFVDFENGNPIDILPSRRKEDLIEYFEKIPLEERENVLLVGMDMWDTYRRVAKHVFPNCLCCADHYHIIQDMNRKIDKIRVRIMNKFKHDSNEYYLLKHFNWILFKRSDEVDKNGNPLFDPNREKKYNFKFKKELSYYDILSLIKEIDDELNEAIYLKQKCVDFYDNSSYETASNDIKELISSFRKANSDEMKAFGDTLANWKNEVINSFIVVDHEYKVDHRNGQVVIRDIKINSAVMERQNSTVKTLKKVTMGMNNWERFRNRALYAIRSDASYRLNPIDHPKARNHYKKK